MKKALSLVLALAMCAALLAGCGSSATTAPAQTSAPSVTAAHTAAPTPETTPVPTPEPTPEPTPDPTPEPTPKAADLWKIYHYVDDFKQPTDKWYIGNNKDYFEGTYSNSISTNSDLRALMQVDEENIMFAFLLYSFSNEMMKNIYYTTEYYDIVMRLEDDTRTEMTGYMPAGANRIVIDSEYRDIVLDALNGTNDFMLYVTESSKNTLYDRSVSYLFTVQPGDFAQEYAAATASQTSE